MHTHISDDVVKHNLAEDMPIRNLHSSDRKNIRIKMLGLLQQNLYFRDPHLSFAQGIAFHEVPEETTAEKIDL